MWSREKIPECDQVCLLQIPDYKRGDEVLVKSDEQLVRNLQEGHGEWNDTMVSVSWILNIEQSSLCTISVSFSFFVIIVEWASIYCARKWSSVEREWQGDGKSRGWQEKESADMLVFGGTRSC